MPEPIYEYATKSWPIANGCSPNMPCAPHCWAKRTVRRLAESPSAKVRAAHEGLTVYNLGKPGSLSGTIEWTGVTRLNEAHLTDPLRWRKPQRIAVAYHGDLFRLPAPEIDRVFAVMALCPQHQFLVLTKAAREMREYCASDATLGRIIRLLAEITDGIDGVKKDYQHVPDGLDGVRLPNVWLGVSVTNQADADERIPLLLQTPAAVRWVSMEPMVGPVDLTRYLQGWDEGTGEDEVPDTGERFAFPVQIQTPKLDWVVLGGESGPDARPFDLAWARSIIGQCKAAGVPVFMKQLGAKPEETVTAPSDGHQWQRAASLKDRKGANPSEWPEDLRVREMPEGLR